MGHKEKFSIFIFFHSIYQGGVKCYTPCYISVCRLNLDLQTMLYMYALIATQPPHLIQNNSFAVEPIGSKASYCSGGWCYFQHIHFQELVFVQTGDIASAVVRLIFQTNLARHSHIHLYIIDHRNSNINIHYHKASPIDAVSCSFVL